MTILLYYQVEPGVHDLSAVQYYQVEPGVHDLSAVLSGRTGST